MFWSLFGLFHSVVLCLLPLHNNVSVNSSSGMPRPVYHFDYQSHASYYALLWRRNIHSCQQEVHCHPLRCRIEFQIKECVLTGRKAVIEAGVMMTSSAWPELPSTCGGVRSDPGGGERAIKETSSSPVRMSFAALMYVRQASLGILAGLGRRMAVWR